MSSSSKSRSIFDLWLESRKLGKDRLVPGAQRQFNAKTIRIASIILRDWAPNLVYEIFSLQPRRTLLLLALSVLRAIFPAFRGYSQALIIDEIQRLFVSGQITWSGLGYLVATEVLRRFIEGTLESFIVANENLVLQRVKFHVEQKQLQHRVEMDCPTLSDPIIRDLFQEADLFVRSFNGSGFGLLSPLDFMQVFCLITEIISYVWLVISLTKTPTHLGILLLSIGSAFLPSFLPQSGYVPDLSDSTYSAEEIDASNRQEKMRNLAYSDAHRPEVMLFGLGPWVAKSWTQARKTVIEMEQPRMRSSASIFQGNFSDLIFAAQNLPYVFLMQSSSATLGALTLYRSSITSLTFALRNLYSTLRMAFQSIFLIGAYLASMQLRPKLEPSKQDYVPFRSLPNGMKIEARNLSYTYPGALEPALHNVSFTLEAGESLAIVGVNGSGKTTLSKILLRLIDFDGDLLINDIDIRRYDPQEYHSHVTGVLQNFSKWNSTVRENVGIGQVSTLKSVPAVQRAVHLAEADTLVNSLPSGLNTLLEPPGFESLVYPGSMTGRYPSLQQGLSGGEWQRIAIARSFMRAQDPAVGLILLDEPTSSLDAHAQKTIFDTILGDMTQPPNGKTVIFITHRIYSAHKADRIAMMDRGTIIEYGKPNDLLGQNGAYASMLRASAS